MVQGKEFTNVQVLKTDIARLNKVRGNENYTSYKEVVTRLLNDYEKTQQ